MNIEALIASAFGAVLRVTKGGRSFAVVRSRAQYVVLAERADRSVQKIGPLNDDVSAAMVLSAVVSHAS